jgi:hypothetical protein
MEVTPLWWVMETASVPRTVAGVGGGEGSAWLGVEGVSAERWLELLEGWG